MFNIELNFPLCLVFDEITEFDIRNTGSLEELKHLVFLNIYRNWFGYENWQQILQIHNNSKIQEHNYFQ